MITASAPGKLVLSYEPFTFRFGLYLMMLAVCALACVGTYRLARFKWASR